MKDIPLEKTVAKRTDDHGTDGRFMPGNRAAVDSGHKHTLTTGLGDEEHEVAREANKLRRTLLKELPAQTPAVQALVAQQARQLALAGYYHQTALKVGLDTPAGMKFAEQSRAHDNTAKGLGVAAYDRSVRALNGAPPPDNQPWLEADA